MISIGTLPELRKSSRYEYRIKLPPKVSIPALNDGEITEGTSGHTQIMTNESEAFRIAKLFSEQSVKFSISPVTLDDIFFYIVGQKARDK